MSNSIIFFWSSWLTSWWHLVVFMLHLQSDIIRSRSWDLNPGPWGTKQPLCHLSYHPLTNLNKVCANVSQLWAWLFYNCQEHIFHWTQSLFFSEWEFGWLVGWIAIHCPEMDEVWQFKSFQIMIKYFPLGQWSMFWVNLPIKLMSLLFPEFHRHLHQTD